MVTLLTLIFQLIILKGGVVNRALPSLHMEGHL